MEFDLEAEIAAWRDALQKANHLDTEMIQELEDHLRDEIESLVQTGLREDEALIIGIRRLGNAREIGRELAHVNSDKLWKHLFEPPTADLNPREVAWIVAAALLAAFLGKIPLLFGVSLNDAGWDVYARNASLFVAPILMVAYVLKSGYRPARGAVLFAAVISAALAANLYPFRPGSDTSLLLALHLPLLMWLGVGLAYCGDEWQTVRAPVDFIRFTGEFFLYSVLILCGGGVLTALIATFFEAIDIPSESWVIEYVAFSGLLATPVVAAYLVEKKRSLIENLAPVLARIFIPLFVLMMIGYIAAVLIQQKSIVQDRDMLIVIDVLLLLVVGMVLYDLSARGESEAFSFAHGLNISLIAAAILIDAIALYGILGRLSEYGFTPNRVAALGENVLLLGNLLVLGAAYVRMARAGSGLSHLWLWQVRYLAVYAAWFTFVVFALPPLFGFR